MAKTKRRMRVTGTNVRDAWRAGRPSFGRRLYMPRARMLILLAVAGLGICLPAAYGDGPPDPPQQDDAALFNELPMVQAASLHLESIEKAPATVTIITDEDIRKFGYRTLADALNSVSGFYFTNDHTYYYPGVRGFSLPGDYGTRLLVMINGHCMQDNILNGNSYFGQDFPLDMQLVKRIEVVRGPSSALYGSNGILATINIVTRSPLEHQKAEGTVETGSFGQKRLQGSTSLALPHGVRLLVSGSVFDDAGQSLYFPQYDTPQTNNGVVSGSDGERGYHAFVNLHWNRWDVTALLGDRRKEMPAGWTTMPFDGSRETVWDSRNFVEGVYSRDVGATANLTWRVYYDWVRYHDDELDRATGVDVRTRDLEKGDWVGSRLAYQFMPPRLGTFTVGADASVDIEALQQEYALLQHTYYVNANHPDASLGLFLQDEKTLSQRWKAVLGVRLDQSSSVPRFVSPRAALLYQASPKTVYKILYGRAFRNPSDYERYYADGIYQSPDSGLRQEGAHTVELAAEHKLTPWMNAMASGYYYRLDNLIQDVLLPSGLFQFQNGAKDWVKGLEMELNARKDGFEAAASAALLHGNSSNGTLPNSPAILAKLRLAAPLKTQRITCSTAFQYMGERQTLAGATVPPVFLWDLTLSTHRLHPLFDVVAGMRNVLDRRSYDPTALFVDTVPADGRAFFVRVLWRSRE